LIAAGPACAGPVNAGVQPVSVAVLAEATKPIDLVDEVRRVAQSDLPPLVDAIDHGALYPADFLRQLGALGAFSPHADVIRGVDLNAAIDAMSEVAEVCGSTGFMTWCQATLVWYLANTENVALRENMLPRAANASLLGGTGLSNPMKSFFGIEKLKLKGRRVDGGYVVRGALPWVSNIGRGHVFGTIFECDGEKVMFIADCADPKIELLACEPFLAMDGTGTYGVQFKDAFIPDEMVLAHAAMPFVKKIRAGFILLQAGMALGIIRDCIAVMQQTKASLGHVNKYLTAQQPEDFAAALEEISAEVRVMASTPYETSDAFFRRVVELRLQAGDATMAAAHAAMLHTGARGYLKSHRAQRRMREAYFVGIVTPATKQLRKMLADMAA
jgi:alkylation response protein AidB-like acyl-CoA dehydrogenase